MSVGASGEAGGDGAVVVGAGAGTGVGDVGVVDFGPVEDLEVPVRVEEGEQLDAEGGEDEVGVADAVVGEQEAGKGRDQREGSPPEGELEAGGEAGGSEKDRDGDEGGTEKEEETGLGGTAEAEFLVGFGDVFGAGKHWERGGWIRRGF